MKRSVTIFVVLLAFMSLTTSAMADDVADVKAAAMTRLAARNAGDAVTMAKYTHPERSSFSMGPWRTLEEGFDVNQLKGLYDSGFRQNWRIRHLGVKVFGSAAIVTGYANTWSGRAGDETTGSHRFTEVWVKDGGQWKLAHQHRSDLNPPQAN